MSAGAVGAAQRAETERGEETALYGVSVRGPDDLIATRSYEEAARLAQLLNRGEVARIARDGHHENDPLLWCAPVAWPLGFGHAAAHAADLASPSDDYRPVLDYVRGDTEALIYLGLEAGRPVMTPARWLALLLAVALILVVILIGADAMIRFPS